MTPTRRYAQAQNETASPERLMVLLFEAALRHMRSGAAALDAGRIPEATASLARANEIVLELHSTVDVSRARALGENLGAVYRFVYGRLLSASAMRDPGLVREAERAFAPVAEAFSTAVGQLPAARADQAAR